VLHDPSHADCWAFVTCVYGGQTAHGRAKERSLSEGKNELVISHRDDKLRVYNFRRNTMPNTVKPIPDGYHTITPYLTVMGVAKLIEFIKQAFDATVMECMMRADGTVQHAQAKIGDSIIMMGEAQGEWQPRPSTLYLYVSDVDATYRRAIQAGATSLREPANHFYGDRSGGVQDTSGNQWWIATHIEDVSREEMARRAQAAGH